MEVKEREMQEKLEASERERLLKQHQHKQELRLAKEMERLKWEEERDKRYRQQIKENRYGRQNQEMMGVIRGGPSQSEFSSFIRSYVVLYLRSGPYSGTSE